MSSQTLSRMQQCANFLPDKVTLDKISTGAIPSTPCVVAEVNLPSAQALENFCLKALQIKARFLKEETL